MKWIVWLLLLPCVAAAQKIILVDRNLKAAITLTQAFTTGQLTTGRFPIYASDLDQVIRTAETLVQALNGKKIQNGDLQLLSAGHSQLAVTAQPAGNAMTYAVVLNTRAGNVEASMKVVARGSGNRRATKQLLQFLDYLKNNRHLAGNQPPTAILPQ